MPFTEQKHHKKDKNTKKINKQIETNLSKKNISDFSYENIAKTTPYQTVKSKKNAPAVVREVKRPLREEKTRVKRIDNHEVSPYGKFRRELIDISKGKKKSISSESKMTPPKKYASSRRDARSTLRQKPHSLTTTIDQYMTDKILKERLERRNKEKEEARIASSKTQQKIKEKTKHRKKAKTEKKNKYDLDTVDMLLDKLPMDE